MFEKTIIRSDEVGVSSIKTIGDNTIVYSTQANELKFLNIDNIKTSIIIKTSKQNRALLFCFSPEKRKLAYVDNGVIIILDTILKDNASRQRQAKRLNKIELSCMITAISFDTSGRYLFVGTQDNIVYQYKFNSDVLLSTYELFQTFKKRTKGITALEFNKSTMAVSGNRGDLFVVDIYTKISQKVFINESTTINDIKFIDDNTIITAHENGDSRIANINKFNEYKKLDIPLTKIKQTLFLANKDYMLVCGNEDYISLIDVKNQKNIRSSYLSFEHEVKAMVLASDFVLVVVLVDNSLVRVNLPTPKQLESLILHGALDQAYELVRKEPQLLHSQEYKNLENMYQNILERVAQEIPQNNKKFAIQTVDFFKDVLVKKNEIMLVLEAFDRYEKFQDMVIQRDYVPAYNLIERYPILKKTREYKFMESKFRKEMTQAQEMLIKGNKDGAYVQLGTYIRIKSKHNIVKLFLNHGKEFLPYLDLLRSKDIEGIQEAMKIDKHFSKYVQYLGIDLKIRDIRKEKIEMITNLIDSEEFEEASKVLEDLKEHVDIKIFNELKIQLQDGEKLYSLYHKKEFAECYNFMDTHQTVAQAKITKILEAYWMKLMIKTEDYCIEGDIKNLEKIVLKYQTLQARKSKLDDLTKNVILQSDTEEEQEEKLKYHEKLLNHALVKKIKLFNRE